MSENVDHLMVDLGELETELEELKYKWQVVSEFPYEDLLDYQEVEMLGYDIDGLEHNIQDLRDEIDLLS